MPTVVVPIQGVDKDYLSQLDYALTFASEEITSYKIDADKLTIEAEVKSEAAREVVSSKIRELVERYQKTEFGMPTVVHFEQKRDLVPRDAWQELLDRRWVTPIGVGHVVLRGPAAQLMSLIDAKVQKSFAAEFGAELEIYPPTIRCETLDRCQHFTSFPEHMDFVGHLKQDLSVLNHFSNACKEGRMVSQLTRGTNGGDRSRLQPLLLLSLLRGDGGLANRAARSLRHGYPRLSSL